MRARLTGHHASDKDRPSDPAVNDVSRMQPVQRTVSGQNAQPAFRGHVRHAPFDKFIAVAHSQMPAHDIRKFLPACDDGPGVSLAQCTVPVFGTFQKGAGDISPCDRSAALRLQRRGGDARIDEGFRRGTHIHPPRR